MSAVLAVIARLEAVSAVTALVPAARIYNGVLPQDAVFPAIRVQRVSEDERMHLRGMGRRRTRVQVDAISAAGDPVGAAQAIDSAIHGNGSGSALVGFKGTVGGYTVDAVLPTGVREGYDADELRQYRVMRDVFVWWQ